MRLAHVMEQAGHEVKTVFVDHFQSCHSYLAKKLDEWHVGNGRQQYDRSIFLEAVEAINEWQADKALFVNYGFREEWREEFRTAIAKTKCHLLGWVIDPIQDVNDLSWNKCYNFYDKVFFYEKYDAEAMTDKLGIKAEYCPVGYNDAYVISRPLPVRYKRDIVFVGSPYKSRLNILERLAVVCRSKGWHLEVYGPFWSEGRYFWKKYQKMLKYPNIRNVVHDGVFSSAEIAKLYSETKICLNLHTGAAKGMNPRSYEIMATGAFQLLDKRQSYDTLLVGEGFDEFVNFEDLVNKLEFYLTHEAARQSVIAAGQTKINVYSMTNVLAKILGH